MLPLPFNIQCNYKHNTNIHLGQIRHELWHEVAMNFIDLVVLLLVFYYRI